MEDRTNEHLVIYDKNGQVITSAQPGVKEIELEGLVPDTEYTEGSYQIAWVRDNGDTSEKINVPDFKTLAILVDSINLSQTALTGVAGTKLTNGFSISPLDATNKDIDVSSEDKTVADVTIDNNSFTVDLIKAGQTNINFKSKDGNASTKVQVTVTEPTPKSDSDSNPESSATPASSASQSDPNSTSATDKQPESAQPASSESDQN